MSYKILPINLLNHISISLPILFLIIYIISISFFFFFICDAFLLSKKNKYVMHFFYCRYNYFASEWEYLFEFSQFIFKVAICMFEHTKLFYDWFSLGHTFMIMVMLERNPISCFGGIIWLNFWKKFNL
jgi:hypothetical protein